jgi:hypothetical protein
MPYVNPNPITPGKIAERLESLVRGARIRALAINDDQDVAVVWWQRSADPDDHVTHRVHPHDHTSVALYGGHYDLTSDEAARSFAERAGFGGTP